MRADFLQSRVCKPICGKSLILPSRCCNSGSCSPRSYVQACAYWQNACLNCISVSGRPRNPLWRHCRYRCSRGYALHPPRLYGFPMKCSTCIVVSSVIVEQRMCIRVDLKSFLSEVANIRRLPLRSLSPQATMRRSQWSEIALRWSLIPQYPHHLNFVTSWSHSA